MRSISFLPAPDHGEGKELSCEEADDCERKSNCFCLPVLLPPWEGICHFPSPFLPYQQMVRVTDIFFLKTVRDRSQSTLSTALLSFSFIREDEILYDNKRSGSWRRYDLSLSLFLTQHGEMDTRTRILSRLPPFSLAGSLLSRSHASFPIRHLTGHETWRLT